MVTIQIEAIGAKVAVPSVPRARLIQLVATMGVVAGPWLTITAAPSTWPSVWTPTIVLFQLLLLGAVLWTASPRRRTR